MPSTRNCIPSFLEKLAPVDPLVISTDPYCQQYLGYLLSEAPYFVSIYSFVIDKALEASGKPVEELCFADIGAGNGLLAAFASHCGFRKVVVNEINTEFLEASRNLGRILGLPATAYIQGEVIKIAGALKPGEPDICAGTDVIEHIYDLPVFFEQLVRLNPNLVTVFTTAANPANFIKATRIKRLQRRDEWKGGNPSDFPLFGKDPHPSFLEIRLGIVSREFPSLDLESRKTLAAATRGLKERDIIIAGENYLKNGKLPVPEHPTNTCHPLTGSWTERLLTLEEYNSLHLRFKLRLRVFDGFYNPAKKGVKRILNIALNRIICILGHRIAPFIVLVGKKE